MAQITITLELTPENLEKLKALCGPEKPIAVGTAPMSDLATQDTPTETPLETKEEPTNDAPEIPAADVRAVALKLSKAGKQDFLKEAFAEFGGKKFSDIKPKDYPALMKKLNGGLSNA